VHRLACALAAALLAPLVVIACGRGRDLGVDTSTSAAGVGGATTSTHTGTGGATTTTSGTGGGPVEPTGPTRLTVVNGINDYDTVRFCFLPGDTPWPAAAGGMPFAAGQAVNLAADLPQGTDLTPWVIAGDLSATAGKTCTEILALAQPADGGPAPPVVAALLGIIPKGVLTSDRSLLFVATGCMGGPGHDDGNAASGCGMGYSSQAPTTGVVFLAMSRITDPKHVALQVVSASPALPLMDVRLLPSVMKATEASVAPSLPQGGIEPSPPFRSLDLAAFGQLGSVQIKTYPPGTPSPSSTTNLSDVLSASTVGTAGFVDGAGLVLVAVGATPGAAPGPFWHKLTYALIKADPG
jgi:hypothetical protein